MVPLPPGTSRAMSQLTFFITDVRICSISTAFNWEISILCRGKLRSDQLAKLTSSPTVGAGELGWSDGTSASWDVEGDESTHFLHYRRLDM